VSDTVTDLEEPFKAAVMLADWSARTAPVLAVNVAEVALAATLTEDATVNTDGRLFDNVTAVLVVTDFDSVTVQVVFALEARLALLH
jgi:hypothetical protein